MAEYIKKDKLLKFKADVYDEDGHVLYAVPTGCIVAMPPADVAPVRHARWVDNHCTACGMMPMGDDMWKHCDFEPPRFEWFMDYCPSCGCRMDG